MKFFCSCSQDTYITDKIVNDTRQVNANVGQAGTLDLFKLFAENTLRGEGSQHEISRILLRFDLSKLKKKFISEIDTRSSSFSARLKMFDISTGNSTPSNFSLMVAPLSQSFIEGQGREVDGFSHKDFSNFLTASHPSGVDSKWFASGANAGGIAGEADKDWIEFIDFRDGNGVVKLYGSQYFQTGNEDLDIDVTKIVSASLREITDEPNVNKDLKNFGLRLSFSGSDDTDNKTRFVKRFASRHVSNPHLRPRIEISYDDSIQDNHQNFVFNTTGSIFIQNAVNPNQENINSGVSGEMKGYECMRVRLESRDFSTTAKVSQIVRGSENVLIPGLYSASLAIDAFDDSRYTKDLTVAQKIARDGSIDFRTYWETPNGNFVFHTGSLTIRKNTISLGSRLKNFEIFSLNVSNDYTKDETVKIRLVARDNDADYSSATRTVTRLKTFIIPKTYYRLVDANTGKIVFDFGEKDNSTRISTDFEGMYFNFDCSVAPAGRSYRFEFLAVDGNTRQVLKDRVNFRIV